LEIIVDKSDGIKLLNTDTKKAKKDIELGVGVKIKVVSKK
jgi:DNA sulfur modification protein DndE